MRARWTAALGLAAALATTAARADEAPPPAAPPARAEVRVRASHRVDVIAPGESVETVLDRMRAARGARPAGEGRAGAPPAAGPALPVRPPDGRTAGDRPGDTGGGGPMPAAGTSVTGGGLPTGTPRGDGLPSDRPHR